MNDDRSVWLLWVAALLGGVTAWPLASGLALIWGVQPFPFWLLMPLPLLVWVCVWSPHYAGRAVMEAALALGAMFGWSDWLQESAWRIFFEAVLWWQELAAGIPAPPPENLARTLMLLCGLGGGTLAAAEALGTGATRWTLGLGTAHLGFVWLLNHDEAWPLYLRFLPGTMALWAVGASYARDRAWAAAGRRSLGETDLGWTAALAALVLLLAVVIPAPARGLSLGAAGQWLYRAVPVLHWLRGGAEGVVGEEGGFWLAEAGLARRPGELGGPAALSDTPALRIQMKGAEPDQPLYLRGRSRNFYTGRGWELRLFPGEAPPRAPAGLLLQMQIDHLALHTSALFYPRELVQMNVEHRIDSEENAVGRASTYEVTAALGGQSLMVEPERYLQLPPALPERVRTEARRVTAGRTGALEKATAVEAYLRAMPYTLTVPVTPAGRDFVDYFLFDLRRGYCTYSASAMVVMLRAAGVPARWVEGFVREPGMSEIPLRNAHAWVEVFIDGRGWVLFDPTPRFPVPQRQFQPSAPGLMPEQEQPPIPDLEPYMRNLPTPVASPAPGSVGAVWAWTLAAAGLGALLWVWWRRRLDRIEWRDERAAPQQAFAAAARWLARRGLPRRPHQTPLEYAQGVAEGLPDVANPVQTLAAEATEARYAPPEHRAPGAVRRVSTALHALRLWLGRNRRARARTGKGDV